MNGFQKQLKKLELIFSNAWAAYGSILLLQWFRISGIWNYRDLTPGDTSSYFQDAYGWYENGKLLISWSPLYTAFYGTLLNFYNDVIFTTALHRVLIVLAIATLVLAVMRRLLPPSIAWLIAAWWVVLPINFDSLYEFHLFGVIPLLLSALLLASGSIYARGVAVGVLLASALLVRNEQILALAVLIAIMAARALVLGQRTPVKRLLIAYGVPVICALLLTGFFFMHAKDRGPAFYEVAGVKHTLNVCQAYAFGYQQRHPEWKKQPFLDCGSLMQETFGKPQLSYFEAFRRNPKAIVEHMLWNLRLAPNGLQIMLFNSTSGTMNPDYAAINAGSKFAFAATLLLVSVWIAGLILLTRNRRSWWTTYIDPRLWVWIGLFCTLPMAIIVLLSQRPRPSYLFSLAILLMALTGFFVWVLVKQLRIDSLIARLTPVAAIGLLVFSKSYYPRPGIDQAQTLNASYRTLLPYRPLLRMSGTVLLTPNHPAEICNYVGLGQGNCNGISYWEARQEVKTAEDWAAVLGRRGVNIIYADQSVLDDPERPRLLSNPSDSGWSMIGRQNAAGRNWVLVRKSPPNAQITLTARPESGRGSKSDLEIIGVNQNGVQDIATTVIIINSTFVAANSCYISHDQGTNIIWLSSDDTKSWIPVTPPLPDVAQNSQCILSGKDSSITSAGQEEVLRLSITFKDTFVGDKKIYGFSRGKSGNSFNWAPIGSWRVSQRRWFGF